MPSSSQAPATPSPITVEILRAGVLESRHVVDAVAVDRRRREIWRAGAAETVSAFRSCAKPLQARAAIQLGWQPPNSRCLAIACGSHRGEQGHVACVKEILSAAGVPPGHLECPPAYPDLVSEGEPALRSALFHCCSGKHSAMLAASVAAGTDPREYLARTGVVQSTIATVLRGLGFTTDPITDGCGAPTWTGSLAQIASAFLSIYSGEEAAAMRAEPWYVGGTGSFDSELMAEAPDLVAKLGAEGLVCVANNDLAVCAKVRDGADRARGPAMLAALAHLGLVDEGLLPGFREVPVLGGGLPVGAIRANVSVR